MQRKKLTEGVFLSAILADKFKTCRIAIHFLMPSRREDATCAALLPLVLERSCAAWPDMTEFSKKLAGLYGASLSAESTVQGTWRDVSISISGIKDRFALAGESLSAEYARVLFEVAFSPFLVNGAFEEDAVRIEKEKLRQILENEINEKRLYCLRQARRRFFGDSPAGVEKNGYLEELDAVTPKMLIDFYDRMVRTAQIELMVIGADEQAVACQLQSQLDAVQRGCQPLPAFQAMNVLEKPVQASEDMDTVQGKLCLLFTTGRLLDEEEYAAMRVASAIYGSLPTSRLFMNVREKQSLCYYCAAGFSAINGMLSVDSGIEHANARKAQKAILDELYRLQTELVTEKELEDAKRALEGALAGVEDSLYGIENWYLGGILRGSIQTPEQVACRIAPVTAQRVRQVFSMLHLSVVYLLKKGGVADE